MVQCSVGQFHITILSVVQNLAFLVGNIGKKQFLELRFKDVVR